jgi:hypothetical protein
MISHRNVPIPPVAKTFLKHFFSNLRFYVLVYENGKMRTVETAVGMGEGRGE